MYSDSELNFYVYNLLPNIFLTTLLCCWRFTNVFVRFGWPCGNSVRRAFGGSTNRETGPRKIHVQIDRFLARSVVLRVLYPKNVSKYNDMGNVSRTDACTHVPIFFSF